MSQTLLPTFQDIRTLMTFLKIDNPDDLFDGYGLKVSALLKGLNCSEQELGNFVPFFKSYRVENGLLLSSYQHDNNYLTITPTQDMFLEASYLDIFQLSQQTMRSEFNIKFLFKTMPYYIQTETPQPNLFTESRKMALHFAPNAKIGVLNSRSKILINFDKFCFNFRALRFNVMPYISTEFPFSIIILLEDSGFKVLIHDDIAKVANIPTTEQVCFEGFRTSSLNQIENNFIRLKQKFNLNGSELLDQSQEINNMHYAANSHVCIVKLGNEMNKLIEFCKKTLRFLPVIYDQIPKVGQVLPDLVSQDGESYIRLKDLIEEQVADWKIEQLKADSGEVSVLSWNLQAGTAMFYGAALQVQNPISGWRSYKIQRYLQVIREANPDICLFSEAQPADDFAEYLQEEFQFVKTELNSFYRLGEVAGAPAYQTQTSSGMLVRRSKFEVLEKVGVYPSKLAFDLQLLKKIGGEHVNAAFASFCDRFNTHTVCALKNKVNGEVVVCGAFYPVWVPGLESVKYLMISYGLQVLQDLAAKYGAEKLVFGGDLNIRAGSCVTQMLRGAQLGAKCCDEITRPFVQSDQKNCLQMASFQEMFGADAVLDLRRFGALRDAMQNRGNEGVEAPEFGYKFSIQVPGFTDVLDYIFERGFGTTTQRLNVYQPQRTLGDFACPSDHVCLGAVLK